MVTWVRLYHNSMLKFGIHKISQLTDKSKCYGIFGDKKHFSIALYGEISHLPDSEELSQEILMQFADTRGVYKRTYSGRFEEFDKQCVQIIHKTFFREKIFVHDVGVSDARTSCDFYEKLHIFFPDCEFYASDFYPDVIILYKGSAMVVINDSLEVLETTIPPFVWNRSKIRKEKFLYPVNFLLKWLIEKTITKKMLDDYRKGNITMQKKLSLFCQKAKELSQSNPCFHLLKHNILDKSPIHGLSVLRAMNILNPSYFSTKELQHAILSFLQSIVENGIFITGSNQDSDSIVHGTIYQKKDFCFVPVAVSGQGSPVNDIVCQIKALRLV